MHNCQHNHCQKDAMARAEQLCQEMGARFTDHRRHVLEIIWQSHKALTAADIMAQMESKHPPITYRALDFLKNTGLIHQITSLNAFVGCPHPEHDGHVAQMLVCTQCRDVVETSPVKDLSELTDKAAKLGFHPTQTHIEMLGLCDRCYAGQ